MDDGVSSALTKAQERAQILTERNEKLVDEKTALLEKQSTLLERVTTAQDKVESLRGQLDATMTKDQLRDVLSNTYGLIQDALERIETKNGEGTASGEGNEDAEAEVKPVMLSKDDVLKAIRGVLKQVSTRV